MTSGLFRGIGCCSRQIKEERSPNGKKEGGGAVDSTAVSFTSTVGFTRERRGISRSADTVKPVSPAGGP